MSLATLELALLDYAASSLTACNRSAPTRRLRYNGDVAVQCCDGDGLLTIHWNPITTDTRGLNPGTGLPVGPRMADLLLRLYRCHPVLKADGTFPEGAGDDASAGLADDLDCLWSAFGDAICDQTFGAYLAVCDGLELLSAAPRRPLGGCAGFELRFRAKWLP